MGTDLRWAVAEEREGVFVAVVVPRCPPPSLSRDVILKSGSLLLAAGKPVKR